MRAGSPRCKMHSILQSLSCTSPLHIHLQLSLAHIIGHLRLWGRRLNDLAEGSLVFTRSNQSCDGLMDTSARILRCLIRTPINEQEHGLRQGESSTKKWGIAQRCNLLPAYTTHRCPLSEGPLCWRLADWLTGRQESKTFLGLCYARHFSRVLCGLWFGWLRSASFPFLFLATKNFIKEL